WPVCWNRRTPIRTRAVPRSRIRAYHREISFAPLAAQPPVGLHAGPSVLRKRSQATYRAALLRNRLQLILIICDGWSVCAGLISRPGAEPPEWRRRVAGLAGGPSPRAPRAGASQGVAGSHRGSWRTTSRGTLGRGGIVPERAHGKLTPFRGD